MACPPAIAAQISSMVRPLAAAAANVLIIKRIVFFRSRLKEMKHFHRLAEPIFRVELRAVDKTKILQIRKQMLSCKMIPRQHHALIASRLGKFPAVGLVGPRQAGKTTLARQFSSRYFDLEQEADRTRLDLQWETLVADDELIVLDEAQCWPEIFARLRGTIDARRKTMGRFLLLGSVSPAIMSHVGESLAGRIALVDLPPFTAVDLPSSSADALWRCGGFPDGGVLDESSGAYPVWQESYLRQMAHRDLPLWGFPSKPQVTERLLKLLAAVNGAAINASQLGLGMGLSYHTIQSYLDFLEGAFLLRRLRPFHAGNFPKRLVKSPKLYWRDSGLLHSLLGLPAGGDLFSQPWVGASYEGWVIEQILASRQGIGESLDAYFFRTSDGLECDLLIDSAGTREVIEIKLSSTPAKSDFAKLDKIADLVGARRRVLISRIRDQDVVEAGDKWSMNLESYLARVVPQAKPRAIPVAKSGPSVDALYQSLLLAAGNLVEAGVLNTSTLMQRAQWLKTDLEAIPLKDFQILPSRWIQDQSNGLAFRLVEYVFGKTDHDIHRADNPLKIDKNVNAMTGTGLDREDLLFLGKVAEIGHTLLPDVWPTHPDLRKNLALATQHIDTLNEVWWLARWHGIDPGSIQHEVPAVDHRPATRKCKLPCVDWRFTLMGGQLTLRVEVKNRRGTKGSAVFEKGVNLFGNTPEECFDESAENEINVLAITAYHAGHITADEEAALVDSYFRSLERPVVDAVALCVKGGQGSYEKLYFPANRDLKKKDLLLRAIFRPMDAEDHATIGTVEFPISWTDAGL